MMFYYLSGIVFLFLSTFSLQISLIYMNTKKSLFLEWNVLNFNSMSINMFILIDWMSMMFLFTVMLITSMVMFYSKEYMSHDKNKFRFFYLVLMFVISMLLMILSPNLISILIGWDGLGLISYCLVIYYQSYSSFNSGMLTVLMNRIGDVLILLSVGFLMMFGSWNFTNMNFLNWVVILMVMLAAFTKSAQFPFSAWLPAAMAAPTPVSSLVHSSTLVTAGVYLLIRFHYLLYKFDNLLHYMLLTGLFTMLMAGLAANFEFDIKKIIAYSTLSQLGLMMMIISVKDHELAFLHLVIHAMFKSMMFMCSGILIHTISNYQDIRLLSGVGKCMPFTTMIFMVSSFSLCGMPFMSGFYSKDRILETVMSSSVSMVLYFYLVIGTGLTVSYSVRLMNYLVLQDATFIPYNLIMENKDMILPLLSLLLNTVLIGYHLAWIMNSMIETIYLMFWEKTLIVLICLIFIILSKILFKLNNSKEPKLKLIYFLKYFLGKMWFLYNLNYIFVNSFLNMGLFINKVLDKGYLEWMFKKLILSYSNSLNRNFIKLNMNYLLSLLLMISYFIMILYFLIS